MRSREVSLGSDELRQLLEPYVAPFSGLMELSDGLLGQVAAYLELLLRWNARVSLTAIRSPEEIVTRHFGESFFVAGHLAARLPTDAAILDFGTGPGFPGLPIQMILPAVRVTVAEVQAKKVAFLREVVRTLGLSAEIWPRRVEDLGENLRFDAVTMRAVEKMVVAVPAAQHRVKEGGYVAALAGSSLDLSGSQSVPVPDGDRRRLLLWRDVPRGTIV